MNLKARLEQGETVSAPGVFDPFSARIADKAGFDVLYMTGYGVNATLLGEPDAGFASYSEMVGRLQAIANVTTAAVIADGDTGFGGLANVERAVVGYEVAGADAIQLEDQEFPKRCGHTRNRKVIPAEAMVKKIQVAVAARAADDFLLIARTDALSEYGIDVACSRAESYLNAGADILFIESPENEAEMNRICETFKGTPLVANMVAGGRTPQLPDKDLFAMGFQIVIHPIYLLGAAHDALTNALASLRAGSESDVADINSLNDLLDFSRIWDMDERYR